MSLAENLEKKLSASPESSVSTVLRDFWQVELKRIEEEHRAGRDGGEVALALTELVDAVIASTYRSALHLATGTHALVALGGYGRREMAPYSDIDLLFLFKKDSDKAAPFISGVLHPLWDLGFQVGHGSRTMGEAVRLGRDDLESCTAMMDGRLLAGDQELFAQFHRRFFKRLPRSAISKLYRWRQQRLDHRTSVQLLEPNVKESPGGLRELQTLEWALKARAESPDTSALWPQYLEEADRQTLAQGRAFLWRVRHELHFVAGRKRDVLEHDIKPRIAARLGYRDEGQELAVERFLRHYYLHARAIYHLVELAFDRLLRRPRNNRRSMYLERGVLAVDGELLLADGEQYFSQNPVRLLSIFHLAQAKNLRLSEEAQRAIRASAHLMDDQLRRAPEARQVFRRILRRKFRVALTLRRLHELGVLGAYLPEFGGLTCLVQYDIYHIYTVDEHTLVALENVEALGSAETSSRLKGVFAECECRDLLYLAVLLHDVGKARRQEHIATGVEMARQLGARLELAEEEQRLLLFLVEHHQDMVLISRRRDLDDYRMIADFAQLFPNMDWLRALYLLSYADLSAVSPEAWSEWQEALLWELYHKTAEQLRSGMKTLEDKQRARQLLDEHLRHVAGRWPALKVVAFQEHVEQLPPRYLVAYARQQIERHLELIGRLGRAGAAFEVDFAEYPAYTEMTICTRDQRQLLAKICGALAVNDLDIRRADVNTRDDQVVLDIFQVTDVDGSVALPDWKKERVRQRLEEVITLRLKARDLIGRYSIHWDRRKKKHQYAQPPWVEFENQVSDRYTVIDVNAADDVGLLYKITHCLGELGLDIHMAIVNTVAARAMDAFYVMDGQGQKIVNYEVLEEVRQALLAELAK